MVVRRFALATAVLVVALVACRDTIDDFVAVDRPEQPEVQPIRLTFSPDDDRAPTWNATSDTVFYSGRSADLAPGADATILAIARQGDGLARSVLGNVQEGNDETQWLITPVRAPVGDRFAFVDLEPLGPSHPCPPRAPDVECMEIPPDPPQPVQAPAELPRLLSARVYVRERDALGPIEDDPSLFFDMKVTGDDTTFVVPGIPTTMSRYPPYQVDYSIGREYPFRPSWSPDGERIVVSDGRRLLVWHVENDVLDTIPGTADGVAPVWSPDGARIAFVWTEVTDSIIERCAYGIRDPISERVDPSSGCYETRVKYVTEPARIVLVDPDGSNREIVAEGRDPAWAPDGTLLFAGEDLSASVPLRRYHPATGEISEVAGTAGAHEPSVSPDGQWVAFSRSELRFAPRDIYIVRLQ